GLPHAACDRRRGDADHAVHLDAAALFWPPPPFDCVTCSAVLAFRLRGLDRRVHRVLRHAVPLAMSMSAASVRNQPHPAPHRERVNPWAVWFGLLGAPLAWAAQLLINSALGAHGCYPHDVPLAVPLWADVREVMLGVEVVALLVGVAALVSAW